MAGQPRSLAGQLLGSDEVVARIWKGIKALAGLDTRVGPDAPYLCAVEDFIAWCDEVGL